MGHGGRVGKEFMRQVPRWDSGAHSRKRVWNMDVRKGRTEEVDKRVVKKVEDRLDECQESCSSNLDNKNPNLSQSSPKNRENVGIWPP